MGLQFIGKLREGCERAKGAIRPDIGPRSMKLCVVGAVRVGVDAGYGEIQVGEKRREWWKRLGEGVGRRWC